MACCTLISIPYPTWWTSPSISTTSTSTSARRGVKGNCALPSPPRSKKASSSSSSTNSNSNSNSDSNSNIDGVGSSTFVKPLQTVYPQAPCRLCNDEGVLPCDRCGGTGFLSKGGYQRKNPLDIDRIVGSNWTAMETTFGWRHFRVSSKQRGAGKDWFLEMVATCDENTRLWINAQNLKDRERWSMGWLQKADLLIPKEKASNCKACKTTGRLPCKLCEDRGNLNVIAI